MATELLFVPWGWFEEFDPSEVFSPNGNNTSKSWTTTKKSTQACTWFLYLITNYFLPVFKWEKKGFPRFGVGMEMKKQIIALYLRKLILFIHLCLKYSVLSTRACDLKSVHPVTLLYKWPTPVNAVYYFQNSTNLGGIVHEMINYYFYWQRVNILFIFINMYLVAQMVSFK